MSRPISIRWPWTDLNAALERAGWTTRAAKIEALGITERTWFRWKRAGVPDPEADNAAIRIDSHPGLIWPTWHHGAPPIVTAPPRDTEVA